MGLDKCKIYVRIPAEGIMTIEEVEELRRDEIYERLSLPKQFDEAGLEMDRMYTTKYCIYRLIDGRDFWERFITKTLAKRLNIQVKGNGTKNKPYEVTTKYGDCKCFNIKYLFKDKKCPYKKYENFSNAFQMAVGISRQTDENCDCVSGILRTKKRRYDNCILHSVVELGDWVIDINFGIVISKDFYYKVFMFEELARFSGEQIGEAITILDTDEARAVTKEYNIRSYHLVFALDDLVDFVGNKTRQDGHKKFENLEYKL